MGKTIVDALGDPKLFGSLPPFKDLARDAQDRGDALTPILRALRRKRPDPFQAIDLLDVKTANLSAPRPNQKLKLQNVRHIKRKRIGTQPCPERLNFLEGQDPIARSSAVIRFEPSGRIRLDESIVEYDAFAVGVRTMAGDAPRRP